MINWVNWLVHKVCDGRQTSKSIIGNIETISLSMTLLLPESKGLYLLVISIALDPHKPEVENSPAIGICNTLFVLADTNFLGMVIILMCKIYPFPWFVFILPK
jgi:hypothetical protein